MLEDLDEAVADLKVDVNAANVAINENQNRIENLIEFSETEPITYPDEIIPQLDAEATLYLTMLANLLLFI